MKSPVLIAWNRLSAALLAVALFAGVTGCQSNATLRKAQDAYANSDFASAKKHIDTYVAKEGNGVDRIIAYLELGMIERAAGNYDASNEAFAIADEAIDQIDREAEIQLSKEGVAALTNMNALPYRGYNYDRVMLCTYRGLNYLELGQAHAARVEFIRAYDRQVEAVERNAKRLEKMEEAARESKNTDVGEGKKAYDVERAQQDERFNAGVQENYGELEKYAVYADYVNPFCEFMQGLYFMAAGVDGDDSERMRKSMERAMGMVPDNPYLQMDAELAARIANGEELPSMTYVIFETGVAPKRGQIRIDIPLFLVTGVDYVGANFPRLIMNDNYLPMLRVNDGTQAYETKTIADMDSIVAQEFKNELPIVITKTLIAAGTKAAIAYGVKEATKNQGWIGIAARVGTTVYQVAVNEADLRTWATLPKQFQYARFPTPESRTIDLRSMGEVHTIELAPGKVNVVVVKSINPSAPLLVSQFTIGNESWNAVSSSSPE